jgi:hypothetical protein
MPVHWATSSGTVSGAKIMVLRWMVGKAEQIRGMHFPAQIKFRKIGNCPILIAMPWAGKLGEGEMRRRKKEKDPEGLATIYYGISISYTTDSDSFNVPHSNLYNMAPDKGNKFTHREWAQPRIQSRFPVLRPAKQNGWMRPFFIWIYWVGIWISLLCDLMSSPPSAAHIISHNPFHFYAFQSVTFGAISFRWSMVKGARGQTSHPFV